jgi:hypothetical protein
VTNNGAPEDANGFWFNPHISRQTTGTLLTWTQTGRTNNSCDELRVFWSTTASLQAEAFSCQPYLQSLGTRPLSNTEEEQFQNYTERLKQFDAEVFHRTAIGPLDSQFVFYGSGFNQPSNDEINSINNLAESIILSIIQ